jgi:serine kinase of HPr protein (carbohydrate metabolism regulator)
LIRHAGFVAMRVRGRWQGALIEGPSGSGKSDLALRALDAGFSLVADDRTLVWVSGERLWGRAPETLRGLIEMRGLDVVRVTALPLAQVALIARLGRPERLPERMVEDVLGVAVPVLVLDPFEATAPAKLGRAIQAFDAAHNGRI